MVHWCFQQTAEQGRLLLGCHLAAQATSNGELAEYQAVVLSADSMHLAK